MAENIHIRKARIGDLEWVSDQYRALDFLPSDLTESCIAVLEYGNERMGLGRLVDLGTRAGDGSELPPSVELGGLWLAHALRATHAAEVLIDFLVRNAQGKTVYMLPFKGELTEFLIKLGFRQITTEQITLPQKLIEKIRFCRAQYVQEVEPVYLPAQAGLALSAAKQDDSKS